VIAKLDLLSSSKNSGRRRVSRGRRLEPVRREKAGGGGRYPRFVLPKGRPSLIPWPDLGYATAYHESFQRFQRLRKEGSLPKAVRFQAQYPTPLASVSAYSWEETSSESRRRTRPALFADLTDCSPPFHDQLAVQWDVA